MTRVVPGIGYNTVSLRAMTAEAATIRVCGHNELWGRGATLAVELVRCDPPGDDIVISRAWAIALLDEIDRLDSEREDKGGI